ncbi:hypothetical protein ACEWY4_007074 [Coilia grayii]|uniref:Ig-like domain-containing protein n=1 Tax=Coilia grayii TaxID=363190 RepID=A0ABD1KFB4_9TELE
MVLRQLLPLVVFVGLTSADDIKSVKSNENAVMSENAMLSCDYTVSAYNLFWYRQYPGSAPEFLVQTASIGGTRLRSDIDHRMFVRVNEDKTQVFLEISSVQVSDSAVYYCALEPTVTLNRNMSYKKHPGSQPEFIVLLWESSDNQVESTPPHPRASAKAYKEAKRVELNISSAEVSDSALYYCALRPTATGTPMSLYKNPHE